MHHRRRCAPSPHPGRWAFASCAQRCRLKLHQRCIPTRDEAAERAVAAALAAAAAVTEQAAKAAETQPPQSQTAVALGARHTMQRAAAAALAVVSGSAVKDPTGRQPPHVAKGAGAGAGAGRGAPSVADSMKWRCQHAPQPSSSLQPQPSGGHRHCCRRLWLKRDQWSPRRTRASRHSLKRARRRSRRRTWTSTVQTTRARYYSP